MELTPDLLTSTTFQDERKGGYNKEEVDEFLERVATGVRELHDRLTTAERRGAEADRLATELEQQLADRPNDDEIRRTLVLAQRTASMAIEEANADADKVRAAAEQQAADRLAETEHQLADLQAELARQETEGVASVLARRDAAQAEVDSLEECARTTRSQLRGILTSQLASLDDLNGVAGPETATEPAAGPVPAPAPPVAAEAAPEPEPAEAVEPEPTGEVPAVAPELPMEPAAFIQPEHAQALEPDPTQAMPAPAPVVAAAPARPAPRPFDDALEDDDDDDAFQGQVASLLGAVDDDRDEPAPTLTAVPDAADDADPIEWRTVPIDDEPDDDPFLRELRRAVTDPEPLGPRDATSVPSADRSGDDLSPPSRFFRRRDDGS